MIARSIVPAIDQSSLTLNTVPQPAATRSGTPRPSATIVVVRDGPQGPEVLLMQRVESSDHTSGAWVFPGGLLEAADRRCHALCEGIDDAAASATLGVAEGGLDYYVAAMRESFEEAGLLFASDARGRSVDLQGDAGARLAALRRPLHRGEVAFDALCRDFGLRLRADRLFYIAHWVTPFGRAKRFDTRFFVAVLPPGQDSLHDAVELLDHVWMRPADALSPQNTRRLMTPTRFMLETVGRFADTDSLLAWARSPREVRMVLPRLGYDSTGLRPVAPHEPAFAELGRIEELDQGYGWCEIRPGVGVRLSARVLRVTATDGAHNSYLVGGGERNEWAVIDPGPSDEQHIAALIAAAPGAIRWMLATHASAAAGAGMLAARTGAQLAQPAPGETIVLGTGTSLQVAGVPAAGRVVYLLLEERTLFTGLAATEAAAPRGLAPELPEWLAPGRGFLIRSTD